jgi:hypothetical protein
MAEKPAYTDLILDFQTHNDLIVSTNNLPMMFHFCNDIAKHIQEQAIDTIRHFINDETL